MMEGWLVCPHSRGQWQVLTPFRTQATVARTRDEAISKATRMIADEGGGYLTVADLTGLPAECHRVAPSFVPYRVPGARDGLHGAREEVRGARDSVPGPRDGSVVQPAPEEEGVA